MALAAGGTLRFSSAATLSAARVITVNGTAMIFAQGECDRAGLTLPKNQIAGRGELVF